MPFIFISSTGNRAGKSLLAWAVSQRLTEMGKKTGYFKPFSTKPVLINNQWTDSDAVLFKETLNIGEPLDMICPNIVFNNPEGSPALIHEITASADKLKNSRDVLIISGAKHAFCNDLTCSIPDANIISEINAGLVLIHRFKKVPTTLYSLLSISSLLKNNIRGIVINRVPHDFVDDITNSVIPVLKNAGISNITVLSEDPLLSCWNLREICSLLNGRILYGEEYLERRVFKMTVGTSDLNDDLKIMKRVYNKIIFSGPPGTTPVVSGILLTGSRMPPDQVIEAARKSMTPLIIVKQDSFSALEQIEKASPFLSPSNTDKLFHFIKQLDRDNFLDRLINSLDL